jgi:hypothetical protein
MRAKALFRLFADAFKAFGLALSFVLALAASTNVFAQLDSRPESRPESKAQPLALFDVSDLGRERLTALQRRVERVGWWVELETQLLIAAPEHELQKLTQRRTADLGMGQASDFALQGRGCSVSAEHELPALAMAGRFALVRAPKAFAPQRWSQEWLRLVPNSVVAKHSRNLELPAAKSSSALAARLANAVDPNRWFADLTTLASYDRSSYSTDLVNARNWLGAQFEALGLSVSYPAFSAPGFSSSNVLAIYQGSSAANEWVLIGGHYDSRNTSLTNPVSTPGAEDNASGCAGVLELARVVIAVRPRRSLLFMCYSGEEQGLYGSTAHVESLQNQGQLGQLKLALVMDMIGFSADSDFDVLLESNASPANQAVLNQFAAAASFAPGLRTVLSNNPFGSDHVPYINAGVPSLLTIENDWNVYTHYHRTTDTPANITNALAMGGRILRMNAAALADSLGGTDGFSDLFVDGFE